MTRSLRDGKLHDNYKEVLIGKVITRGISLDRCRYREEGTQHIMLCPVVLGDESKLGTNPGTGIYIPMYYKRHQNQILLNNLG